MEISIFEIQHEAKIIQNLFQNRLGNRSRNCFVGFRCFGTTSCSFHSAFICMHLPSCSFHLHAFCMFLSFCIHFLSCSFHVLSYYNPFMFIPMCIHFLSYSFHLHACSFHFALISFHVLSFPYGTGSMAWPGDQVQQMVIAKLSLSLSLNNPSNIWHCSKEICHKPTEREGERERDRKRKRKKKRERASELDAKWYGNCRKQGTTGWISLIGFARCVHNSICLVYAKFNGLSCMVPGYFWRGPIALQCSSTFLTKNYKKTPY